ncbi:MAG: beta-ketoacyl-[acyl-carrier-protein] synthase family protein [Gemmataceae bacterium]
MRRRVVITGMGAITPLGNSVPGMFSALLEGKSGVSKTVHFNAKRFPTQFAAQVLDYDISPYVREAGSWEPSGVNTRFALGAAHQALSDAGVLKNDKIDRTRCGVYLGSGEGIQDFPNLIYQIASAYRRESRKVDVPSFSRGALHALHADREAEQELHTTAAHLAIEHDLEGPNYTCLTACAASSQAIGEATELIRHDDADLILAGGSHSMIHPLGVTGFNRLTALSTFNEDPTKASRPFDLRRDGFVMGEGAGMLVLEELEHAKRRGATIYAELTGYGTTADAFRLTDSCEDGRGAIACIRLALKDSGLQPSDIGYINAHGTSTQVNDKMETLAIKKVLGEAAYRVPVSSSKSMLGHLIAAAGAVEMIICVMAMRRGVLPPTINYEVPDPECDLDYIPNQAREKRVNHVLSNSFGFGGQNVSLLVSRFLN